MNDFRSSRTAWYHGAAAGGDTWEMDRVLFDVAHSLPSSDDVLLLLSIC